MYSHFHLEPEVQIKSKNVGKNQLNFLENIQESINSLEYLLSTHSFPFQLFIHFIPGLPQDCANTGPPKRRQCSSVDRATSPSL